MNKHCYGWWTSLLRWPKSRLLTLHASHCHYCIVGFVLFHNITHYANSLLSRVHVNTTCLLNITRILVASCVILVEDIITHMTLNTINEVLLLPAKLTLDSSLETSIQAGGTQIEWIKQQWWERARFHHNNTWTTGNPLEGKLEATYLDLKHLSRIKHVQK